MPFFGYLVNLRHESFRHQGCIVFVTAESSGNIAVSGNIAMNFYSPSSVRKPPIKPQLRPKICLKDCWINAWNVALFFHLHDFSGSEFSSQKSDNCLQIYVWVRPILGSDLFLGQTYTWAKVILGPDSETDRY